MPTESELEDFFAAAEKDIQKCFRERFLKYHLVMKMLAISQVTASGRQGQQDSVDSLAAIIHGALLAKIHPWLLKKLGGFCVRGFSPFTLHLLQFAYALAIGFSNQSPQKGIHGGT
ncbi:hypothetical protein JHK85_023333 [Glycine max]|nr:hypothetical protein JHK85_023333 [Glycine max]KAG5026954.1 hypothetical protein JHK86_022868 [Glycine max]